jgi:hypothetical protein
MIDRFGGAVGSWARRGIRGGVALSFAIGMIAAACSNPSGAADGARQSGAPATACPDDGARLPVTGLCAGRAVNYLNIVEYERYLPEGCEWVVEETPFATDVLLYRAAKCAGQVTKLEFAGGAHMAQLTATGGISHTISVVPADMADPNAAVLATALPSIEDAAERARCKVRKAPDFGPPDALVVDDVTPEDAAQPEEDGPRSACGPYGYNGDEASYWRVFQGYAWFFQMGQEGAYVDPGSFTLMRRGADGDWTQVE